MSDFVFSLIFANVQYIYNFIILKINLLSRLKLIFHDLQERRLPSSNVIRCTRGNSMRNGVSHYALTRNLSSYCAFPKGLALLRRASRLVFAKIS